MNNLEQFVNSMGINIINALEKIHNVKEGKKAIDFDPDLLIDKNWIHKDFRAKPSVKVTDADKAKTLSRSCTNDILLFGTRYKESFKKLNCLSSVHQHSLANTVEGKYFVKRETRSKIWRRPIPWCNDKTFLSSNINTYNEAILAANKKASTPKKEEDFVFQNSVTHDERIDLFTEDYIEFIKPLETFYDDKFLKQKRNFS